MVHPSLYRSMGPVEKDLDGVRSLLVPVFIHRSQSMTRPGRVTARLKGRVPAEAQSRWCSGERGGQGSGTHGGLSRLAAWPAGGLAVGRCPTEPLPQKKEARPPRA